MTASIAEPYPQLPQRPMLRRLVDILPSPMPAPATRQPTTGPSATTPPVTTLPAPDPAASTLAERVLRAMVEILGGRRPAHQLSAVLRPDLRTHLGSLQTATEHLAPRIHKVLIQQHTAGALEAVALVTLSTGMRALAARFDKQSNGKWQCTALQLPLTTGDLATRRSRRP
ncbi:MAG: Rv3235 family protein [Pseudonocardiaceae bacterium]